LAACGRPASRGDPLASSFAASLLRLRAAPRRLSAGEAARKLRLQNFRARGRLWANSRLTLPCKTRTFGECREFSHRESQRRRGNLSVPCRSTNRVFLLSQVFSSRESCAFVTFSSLAVVCRALPHSSGASRHRIFPQLNLHRARVRRNHGRPRSRQSIFSLKALSNARQSAMLTCTLFRERASDKALTLIGS